ncbi:MAG: DUF1211 domain-containing protein [Bacteroidetes bacterium]|nr:DUF1211 domain-containing protein [Bacteroidota bacterium]
MGTNRIEAFSDGMMAIFITIMVLEFKVPEGSSAKDLLPLVPKVMSYVLSFIYVGIYWNNHHHLFHTVKEVSGAILWTNLHFLFWLSLIPFTTAWMGENHFTPLPTALYGLVLLMCAVAWGVMQWAIIRKQGANSLLKKAIGRDFKGNISAVLYVVAIAAAFRMPVLSAGIYAVVAMIWLVPDRRFERVLKEAEQQG